MDLQLDRMSTFYMTKLSATPTGRNAESANATKTNRAPRPLRIQLTNDGIIIP